jgi:predicted NBD/HSP70 family sugar kinase
MKRLTVLVVGDICLDRSRGRASVVPPMSIGFGGPVIFSEQRVVLSTHVGGWNDFDLPGFIRSELGVEVVMDNDANVGGARRSAAWSGRGARSAFLYDALDWDRRRPRSRRPDLPRS